MELLLYFMFPCQLRINAIQRQSTKNIVLYSEHVLKKAKIFLQVFIEKVFHFIALSKIYFLGLFVSHLFYPRHIFPSLHSSQFPCLFLSFQGPLLLHFPSEWCRHPKDTNQTQYIKLQ